MTRPQTALADRLIGTAEHMSERHQATIYDVAIALYDLIDITEQIAPHGTDARLDAWRQKYLSNEPFKECPSDHEPDHHIAHD